MVKPQVSIAIANFNGGRFLGEAVASALRQDLAEIEVIVVDDGSDDDSVERAERFARADPRVRIERLPHRRGAGGARNRAMELARGEWLAVLDSDDFMHPGRLARLVARGRADEAQIAADDLLIFDETGAAKARRFLRGRRARTATWLTAEDFLLETRLFRSRADLGYLKPLIRLDAWRASSVRYDEGLPIGEDHDLLLRLLSAGLACRIDPFLGYFYRKHPASLSHRLSSGALERIAQAQAAYRAAAKDAPAGLARALDRRRASIGTAQAFTAALEALKAGRPAAALAAILRRPQAAILFRMPLAAALGRIAGRIAPPKPARPAASGSASGADVWFVSRQRLLGRTNGSSTYLIDLAQAVRRAGLTPHLLQPSKLVLGRWPVLRLKPEMKAFASIGYRGVVRVGSLVFARDPAIYAAALWAVAARALRRLGLPPAWLADRPAAHGPAAPWPAEELLCVARAIGRRADVVIADYAWQTEALAYALRPDARTGVVMHDLFHQRGMLFREQGAADSIPRMDRETEMRLLGRADAVIAIQKTEADVVARLLPGRRMLVVPMTARPAPAPQPGDPSRILFVGSNTAPNVSGLTWMLDEVWPEVRAARPDAELIVAGGVCRALPPPPAGVRLLGFVDRLEALYAQAGLVVSPLIAGSGLKIKLVEALAHGKACVVTSVTLQGVEDEAAQAVALADAPEAFACAIVRLLGDEAARRALGERALAAVRASFSQDRSQAEFVRWLAEAEGVGG